jgi:hypothetical protein
MSTCLPSIDPLENAVLPEWSRLYWFDDLAFKAAKTCRKGLSTGATQQEKLS